MFKKFALVASDGYVSSWSDLKIENYVEVQCDQSTYLKLGFVQVIDGVAVLDEQKQQELLHESEKPSDLEQLKQENEELRQRIDMSEEALLELSDMFLAATKGVK